MKSEQRRLLLLGGPPGIGKTTVTRSLEVEYWVKVIELDIEIFIIESCQEVLSRPKRVDLTIALLLQILLKTFEQDDIPWIIEGYQLSFSEAKWLMEEIPYVYYKALFLDLETYLRRFLFETREDDIDVQEIVQMYEHYFEDIPPQFLLEAYDYNRVKRQLSTLLLLEQRT